MVDVLPVRSSVSTASSIEDVVIVGQSSGTTSYNTITPATPCGLLEDVVIVGESSSSTSSNTRRPAPVRTKNVQPTLDGHVISTTNAFLLDKSHSAVIQGGQKSVQKRKHLAASFAGALCRAFERQTVKQRIRVAENMAQVQRDGQHATLKPSDVHLVVWRAPQTDDTSIYSASLYAVLGVSENASDTVIREPWWVLALDTHPDNRVRHPDKHWEIADFYCVMEAFDTLRNPCRHRTYDEHLQQRRNNLFFSSMTALEKAQQQLNDPEVEEERKVRELAKKLVQRAQKAGTSADKRTRVAVTALSKCRDPNNTNQSQYSDRRIAQMVLAWRKDVANSRQTIPTFEGAFATVRGWLKAVRAGKFDDVELGDVELSTRAGRAPQVVDHLRTVCKGSGRLVSDDVRVLELHCAKFIVGLNSRKLAVTAAVVMREAYVLNPGMWLEDSEDPVPGTNVPHPKRPSMHRLRTWFKRFANRCKFSWRTSTSVGQKLPSGWEGAWAGVVSRTLDVRRDPDILEAYREKYPEWVGDILPVGEVWNTDQTPAWMETVSKKSYAPQGATEVCIKTGGKHMDRVTVQLMCSMNGDKLDPGMWMYGARLQPGKDPRKGSIQYEMTHSWKFGYPTNIVLSCNDKAYVYEEEMHLYASRSMAKRRGGKKCPGIILLDTYKVHKQIEEYLRKNFNLWSNHIDGGLTPVTQLLDKFPNKMFKSQLHEYYDLWTLTQPLNSLGRITVCSLNNFSKVLTVNTFF